MQLWELLFVAVGLSMDAFAVAVCKGLQQKGTDTADLDASSRKALRSGLLRACFITGLYFGIFQAGMPLIGYLLGARFEKYVTEIDHWIAFGLLLVIGLGMIREAFEKPKRGNNTSVDSARDSSGSESECPCGIGSNDFTFRIMLPLAIATSIDALAVGISWAFLQVNIVWAVVLTGVITFALSFAGVRIGAVFGARCKKGSQIAGGVILILMGIKILLEHLGVI